MKHLMKFALLCLALTLTACHGSKMAGDKATDATSGQNAKMSERQKVEAYVNKVNANNQTAQAVTAKIKMTVAKGSKDISVGGSLSMKRDEVIRLSMTFLGFEVARLEFSPDKVLLLDRYHKEYIEAAYTDVDFLRQAGLDFKSLQALFWGELFAPATVKGDFASHISLAAAGDHTLLTLRDAPKLEYAFLTQTSGARLRRVQIQSKSTADKGQFEWRYDKEVQLGGKRFPTQMNCSVTGLEAPLRLDITLSKLNNDADWTTHTTPPAKYTRRRAADILGPLLNRL